VTQFDTIIVGGGHNGLTCANYLARKNQRVLVLEAADTCGGLAAAREFRTGFKAPVAGHSLHVSERIISDLKLESHGFQSRGMDLMGLSHDGNHITLRGQSVSGVSDEDRAEVRRFFELNQKLANMFGPFWLKTVPRIGNNTFSEMLSFAELGIKMRMLGKEDMQEFLRVITLPMFDYLAEYVESGRLKSLLAWDALIGTKLAPRSPNNSVLHLLYRMAGNTKPTANSLSFISALESAAKENGVQIVTNASVQRIVLSASEKGLIASGVELENGEQIEAARVVSSADPRTTFLKLVGAENLEVEFTGRIDRFRDKGLVSKLHVAMSALPAFTGLDNPNGRMIIAPDLETMEWAFDDAKYGGVPETPVLEVTVPTIDNPDLAPAGQHVLSANIMYTPYDQKEDWDDAAKAKLLDRAMNILEAYAPGLKSKAIGAELLTPKDLEAQYRVSGGHWHHGDFALDQLIMMRPTYGAAQYQTPIAGLHLCGAGTHPAGDLTGMPGHNAAKEILS
jgi:phytoene dehydrogenase-like protein